VGCEGQRISSAKFRPKEAVAASDIELLKKFARSGDLLALTLGDRPQRQGIEKASWGNAWGSLRLDQA
jgi:hypothetical protein